MSSGRGSDGDTDRETVDLGAAAGGDATVTAAGREGRALARDAATPPEALLPTLSAAAGARKARADCGEELDAGDRVGRFVIERCVGRGGMGVVYAARDEKLKRTVAIKFIRDREGQTSVELNERLLREAQAVAPLSHPNLVAVYDVGFHGGEPYVAMEYVDGVTLRSWLRDAGDAERNWRDIVAMFVQAGRGLAAAHAAGVVHRDFKPANVLIADGRARVADFGLARPLQDSDSELNRGGPIIPEANDSEMSTLTQPGTIMGTPRYMAPEQRAGRVVDQRSDQYSFCVALYEALFADAPQPEAIVPVVPRLPHHVRAALARGLRRVPGQRYPGMDELLAELGHQPVSLARRLAMVLVAVVALGAVAGGMWMQRRHPPLCTEASARLRGVWDDDRRSQVHSAFAASGRSYAETTFAAVAAELDAYAADWVEMHTESCTATRVRGEQSEELLDRSMICLGRRLAVLRELTEILAGADLELVDRASEVVARLPALAACGDRERLLAAVPAPPAALRERVAELRSELDRATAMTAAGDYQGCRTTVGAVVDASASLDYPPLRGEALLAAGRAAMYSGDGAAGEASLRAAIVELARADDDVGSAEVLTTLMFVVGLQLGRADDALALQPSAEAAVIRAGEGAELSNRLERVVAILLRQKGRYGEAEARFRSIYQRLDSAGDAAPGAVGRALSDLANILADQGKADEALDYYRRLIALREARSGRDHPEVAFAVDNAGTALADVGEYEQARAYHRRALAIREQVYGADSNAVAITLNNLGVALAGLGEWAEAEAVYRRCIGVRELIEGSSLRVANTLSNLGVLLTNQKKYDEAGPVYARALAIREAKLGPDHPLVATTLYNIGTLLEEQPQHRAEARRHYETALARGLPEWGEEGRSTAYVRAGIGRLDLMERRYREAVANLEQALAICVKIGTDTGRRARTRYDLARAKWGAGARAAALALAEEAVREYRSMGALGEDGRARVEVWLKHVGR